MVRMGDTRGAYRILLVGPEGMRAFGRRYVTMPILINVRMLNNIL